MRAMNDATDRINKIASSDRPRAFAAIGEAVWWIIIVNDTLRHRHRAAYASREWFGLVTRARRPAGALVDHRDGEASCS
jgi:hypothetical protein